MAKRARSKTSNQTLDKMLLESKTLGYGEVSEADWFCYVAELDNLEESWEINEIMPSNYVIDVEMSDQNVMDIN